MGLVKEKIDVVETIATNVAWMYSFEMVDMEEIKAAIHDISLTNNVKTELVEKVYKRYVDLVSSGNE